MSATTAAIYADEPGDRYVRRCRKHHYPLDIVIKGRNQDGHEERFYCQAGAHLLSFNEAWEVYDVQRNAIIAVANQFQVIAISESLIVEEPWLKR